MADGSMPARTVHPVLNLPNVITFARLCAVPVSVWLVLRQRFDLAFALFAAAGLSDAVDGWLARRQGGTALGAMLDPAADKALLVCMYITLAAVGVLPDWLAILVVFRDLVIVGGLLVLWLLGQPVRVRPLAVSKLNTALQLLLVAVALALAGFGPRVPGSAPPGLPAGESFAVVLDVLVWVVAATTLVSGAAYVWKVARAR